MLDLEYILQMHGGVDKYRKKTTIPIVTSKIYGVDISTSSDSKSALTYTDDAIGLTPSYGRGGTFNAGSWEDKFPFNQIKPCMFKNGVVQYYLNQLNYAQKEDGSASDITSGADGDAMIEFPKIYWKIENVSNIIKIRYSDIKVDDNYKCLAHMRGTTEKDFCYISAYLGFNLDGKLRSLSGKTPIATQSITTFRTQAQANGSGYDQMAHYQLTMLQVLFIVMFKNRNSQVALGFGNAYTNGSLKSTGNTNVKGMNYGSENAYLEQIKFCGIEDIWGNLACFLEGLIIDSTTNMLISNQNFNDLGNDYTNFGMLSSATISGYMSQIQGTTETGFIPKSSG
ncbi:MAG: hypothetical protein ACI8WT_001780, partial [Clostridium sp.]